MPAHRALGSFRTEPTDEQRDLIKVLRMGDLLDAEVIARRLRPRAGSGEVGVRLRGRRDQQDGAIRVSRWPRWA
jgi:hypothetical protein